MSDILGSSAGLANMGVAMSFAAVCMIVEQSSYAYITESKRERLRAITTKTPGEFAIDDSTVAKLQGFRAFCLVSLFGVLFMAISSPFISGSRLMATKEFSYLLVGLTAVAGMMGYNLLQIKGGLTKGERSTRLGMMLILVIFQGVSTYLVTSGSNISVAKPSPQKANNNI